MLGGMARASRSWRLGWAIMPLFAIPTKAASVDVPQIVVPADRFRAQRNDRLPTAGGKLLGLIMGNPAARIGAPRLTVGGIAPTDRTICVTMRQVSGAYVASFEWPNPGRPEVEFLLPPGKFDGVGSAAANLAILVRASTETTCGDGDPVLPAAWGPFATTQMFALVNTHQADRAQTLVPRPAGDCAGLDAMLPNRALNTYQAACPISPPTGCGAPFPVAMQLDHAGQIGFIRATVRRRC